MVKKMWAGLLGNFGFAVKIHLKDWMKQGLIKKLQKMCIDLPSSLLS